MIKEKTKYERLVSILKKSKPVFNDNEAVLEKVISQLQEEKSAVGFPELILEFFFGWVYIGWVRRSMVATALVILVFFGYQQAVILKRINDLSGQKIQNSAPIMANLTNDIPNRMMLYRITGKKFSDEKISVSQKEIDNMIKSVNKLQVKYKDLIYLIENDPELKKYVEAKMNENRKE